MCYKHDNFDGDCLECIKESRFAPSLNRYNFADKSDLIGQVVRAGAKPVSLFTEPGKEARSEVKPGGFIGTVENFNTKGNFIKIAGGSTWIHYDSSNLVFKPLSTTPLPEKSLVQQVTEKVVGGFAPAAATQTGMQAQKTAEQVVDALPDFDTIKWILYAVLAVVVLTMIYKIVK